MRRDSDESPPELASAPYCAALVRLTPFERAAMWRAALALHNSKRCFFIIAPDSDGSRPSTARELVACHAVCWVCGRPATLDDFAETVGGQP